ncbi:MAG: putative rane protein [Akkermansiaceae bacterium]|nr:putative rane protein [Akkermansiaceae bacterium]
MQLHAARETLHSSLGTLILRLALATVMIAHALLKLLVFTLPGAAAFFAAHGFPGWTAYPVFALELAGGLLLAAGVAVRIVSLVLIPVMLGALAVHLPNGWMFTAPGGGWEYIALILAALAAQALLGPGAWAWDVRRKSPAPSGS